MLAYTSLLILLIVIPCLHWLRIVLVFIEIIVNEK